jgi:hypothetical protein
LNVRPALVALVLLAVMPARAQAQSGGPGFLFSAPRGIVSVRASWLQPSASSDLFTFVRQQLTIDKRDFNRPAILGEGGLLLSPRVDLIGSVEFSRSRVASESRDFVDNQRLPIVQQTDLAMIHAAAGLKLNLLPRGHSVSRLAWVPRGLVPYVGAGGGVMYYRFQQTGDFVDFQDFDVFTDAFRSEGWAPAAHLFGGADVHVWRGVALSLEGRYVWASADLGDDFSGFEPIDLAGLRLSSGITLVF